jgi:hypothetical protein
MILVTHALHRRVRLGMKERWAFSGKGAIAVGAIVGLIIGLLIGYWTYTQAITRFVGRRQVILVSHGGFIQIIQVRMEYALSGNIGKVEVVLRNNDDVNAHDGIITAGEIEKTPNSINISLLSGEEKTVSLEINPPITPNEETIIFVGVEEAS